MCEKLSQLILVNLFQRDTSKRSITIVRSLIRYKISLSRSRFTAYRYSGSSGGLRTRFSWDSVEVGERRALTVASKTRIESG